MKIIACLWASPLWLSLTTTTSRFGGGGVMAQFESDCSLCGINKTISTNMTNDDLLGVVPGDDGSIQVISTTCGELLELEPTLNDTECEAWAPFVQAGCDCQNVTEVITSTPTAAVTISPTATPSAELELVVMEPSSPTSSPTMESPSCVATNDSETLRNTCKVYGTAFVVLFALFCVLRRRYPRTYAIRSWDAHPTPTTFAKTEYGLFEWIQKVLQVSYDDLQDECGMDGTCLVRINYFGLKLCAVCMVNAIWLIPVYATAKTGEDTECITDSMQSITISHVPSGSARLVASTIAGEYTPSKLL
jgi:hypothetical protein